MPDRVVRAAAHGFVNAHTHLHRALLPLGMPGADDPSRNFGDVLERVSSPLDHALDAQALRAAARLHVAEALLHGTTTLVDHHASSAFIDGSLDVIADACHELGIRALLCYGATEHHHGRDEARRGLAECARFMSSNRRPHVHGMIGLHASFTVSSETLEQAAELCADFETSTHVQVAEDRLDVEDAKRRGANGPLGRMFAAGALTPGSILAHGVHLDQARVRDAAANRLWIVQTPRSNEHRGVGYPLALGASERVTLGTDGYPSDLPEEQRALERLAAVHEPETPWCRIQARLSAGTDLATEHFGEMEMASDLIEFALEPPPPFDVSRPPSRSIEAAATSTRPVARVVVAGHTVVRDGQLLTGDLKAIRAEAQSEATRLWRRIESS